MEWIFEDGTKQLSEAKDNIPLFDAFQYATSMKAKRTSVAGKKRKQPPHAKDSSAEFPGPSKETKSESVVEAGDDTAATARVVSSADTDMLLASEPTLAPQPDVPCIAEYSSSSSEHLSPSPGFVPKDGVDDDKPHDSKELNEPRPDNESPRQFLYLVKPRVSGSQRVLIPLNPKMSIRENLRKKVILEFPTIQVLTASHKALPDGFILEADYLVKFRQEQEELEKLASSVPELTQALQQPQHHKPASSFTSKVRNADDVMTILQRDIGAG